MGTIVTITNCLGVLFTLIGIYFGFRTKLTGDPREFWSSIVFLVSSILLYLTGFVTYSLLMMNV